MLSAGATILGPALTGMATQSNADKAAETAANTLQYEKDQAALKYNNANDTTNQMTFLTGTTTPGVAAVKTVAPILGNTVAGINTPTVVGGGLLAPLVPIDPLVPKKII
jgi:esterase/lipase